MISSDIFDQRPNITISKVYSVIFLNSISRKTKPIIRQKTANPPIVHVLDGSGEKSGTDPGRKLPNYVPIYH